jgi:uncharacterized tellurite resistance protein B-like protein
MKPLIVVLFVAMFFGLVGGTGAFVVSLVLGIVIFLAAKGLRSSNRNRLPTVPSITISVDPPRKPPTSHIGPKPYFVGPKASISVAGYDLLEPLIYVVDSASCRDFDASVLELRRKIDQTKIEYGRALPYWPKLSDATPHQAGIYLQWLAGGRKDPNIEVGYVFIYFYGLERRALVENQDVVPIAEEVVRLISIYKEYTSFCRYASNFILFLLLLKRLKPSDQLIHYLLKLQGGYISEELCSALLSYLAREKKPLPPSWALHLAKRDERTVSSVVVNRVEQEFKKLFAKKYSPILPKMIPQLGSSTTKVKYHAASPSLSPYQDYGNSVPEAQLANVIGWKQQFKPVVEIYNSCIEDLRTYARKKVDQRADDVAAFEALPSELKEEREHPITPQWNALLDASDSSHGIALVMAGKLSELRSIPYRSKLTITQSRSICELADALGACLEPDARFTNRPYLWNEYIAVIKLEESSPVNSPNYNAVNMLLPLAMDVALADGQFQTEERALLKEFLNERFMLKANESRRLDALLECYLKNGVSHTAGLKQKIANTFSEVQRQTLGKFLVEIAAAAEGVSEEEKKSLEQTFKLLGLTKNDLVSFLKLIAPAIAEAPVLVKQASEDERGEAIPPKHGFLDLEKIRQIRIESMQASQILIDAMSNFGGNVELEHETSETQAAVAEHSHYGMVETQRGISAVGISENVRPFYFAAIARSTWSVAELQSVARQCGVTLSAGVEEINAWAEEHLGDFVVVEDGDVIHIRTDLLDKGE